MYDNESRESRMFWILGHDDLPTHVEGLSCAPNTPDAWFFPSHGVSVHESRCFDTEAEAAAASYYRLTDQRDSIAARLSQLGF